MIGSDTWLLKLKAKLDNSTTTVRDLNKQIKSLEKQVASFNVKVKVDQGTKKGFQDLDKQLQELKVNLNDFNKINTTINKGLGTTTEKFVDNSGRVLTVIKKIGDESGKAKVKLTEAANETSKWSDAFSRAFTAFTTYHLIAKALQISVQAVRDMVQNVKELDVALTELKKVTDLEGNSLDNFVKKAFAAGETVAKTGKEMIEAATEFAKAGYDESVILQLGTVANMYTNIADEVISSGDAASFIIAQLKAFNLEATNVNETLKNSQHIIDAVNEVANNFAVSSADIAENLGKSSAVMANAGNTLEETIGLLTAGTEITRNAAKVSNGLKTITLRLQGMTDEGEESFELIANNEKLFNKLGLSLYQANGDLKNTYEILKDLSEVYPTLNAEMKAYVTETLAGKHQSQILAAILKNFSTAVEATETALNSEGSAMRENEKVLDSIRGRLQRFQSEWESLSNSLISSDIIKVIVDFGTNLLKLANSGIVKFIIKNTLLVIALNLASKAFVNLGAKIKMAAADYLLYITGVTKATAQQKMQVASNLTLSQSFTLLAAKARAALVAMASNPMVWIAAAVSAVSMLKNKWEEAQQAARDASDEYVERAKELSANIENIDETIDKFKELKKIVDDSSSSYTEYKQAKEELKQLQEELIKQYGKEAEGIDLVNGSLSEQAEKIKQIKQESAKAFLNEPKNQVAYETAKSKVYGKNSYTRTMGTGADWHYSYDTDWAYKHKEITKEEKTKLDNNKKTYEKYVKDIQALANKYGRVINSVDISGYFDFETKSVDKSKKMLTEWQEYLQKNKDKLISAGVMSESTYNYTFKQIQEELDEIEKKFGTFYKTLDENNKMLLESKGYSSFIDDLEALAQESVLTEDAIQKLLEKYPGLEAVLKQNGQTISKIAKEHQNYRQVVDSIGSSLGDKYTESIKKMVLENDLGVESFERLKKEYPELQTLLDQYGMSLDDYAKKIESLVKDHLDWDYQLQLFNNSMDSLQTSFNALKAAQEEYNEQGFITVDTLQALLKLDEEQLVNLVDKNGKIKLNTDAYKMLTAAKLDEMLATEEQRHYDEVYRLQQQLTNQTTKESTGWFAALWNVIRGGKEPVTQAKKTLADLESEIRSAGDSAKDIQAALTKENELHNARVTLIKKTKVGLKDVNTLLGSTASKSAKNTRNASKATSSTKEWWEEQLSALKDQYNYNEITIEQYISALEKLLSKVQKGTEAYRKINEELGKQKLNQIQDSYKRGTISLDEYLKKLKELIKTYKEGSQAWLDIADKIKSGLQEKANKQKSDLDTAEKAALGLIDEEIDKIKKLKEEKEKELDAEIDAKKKSNDETERAIELARLQEALENAKREKTKRVWREGLGWVWEADQQAIADAQKALDDFNFDSEIEDLEKQKEEMIKNFDEQIDALEAYKKMWEDVADDYETQQQRIILAQKLGAGAEQDILNQRLEALEEYKRQYLATMAEIEKYEKTPSTELAKEGQTTTKKPASNTGSSGSSAPKLAVGSSVKVKSGAKWYADSYGGGSSGKAKNGKIKYINLKGTHPYNIDGLGWVKKTDIQGYAGGGIVDYTGLAMLHGTKNKPEFVFNSEQMKNLFYAIAHPKSSGVLASGGNTTYNFGNISLPNVTNARQFISELKALVNVQKHQ